MRMLIVAVVAALLQQVPGARAAQPRAAVLAAAREFVAPAYRTLAEATARQAEIWREFCASSRPADVEKLRAAFHGAADAWAAIELVRYGPIVQDNRFERMAHWPERQNAVTRALGKLLAREDGDDLEPSRFARVSAAAQGLSALERLLFEPAAAGSAAPTDRDLAQRTPAGARRCAVGTAIAAGLGARANAVLEEWRGAGGLLERLNTGDEDIIREAATRLGTELLSFLEFIADQKLGAAAGKNIETVRPTLAEMWRSGRSLRAIQVNLRGIETLASLLVDAQAEEGRSALIAIATARSIADKLSGPIGALASDKKRRRDLILLRDALPGPRELLGIALTESLGITIGFNSRDGD